jgi:hypothetical protein
MKEVETEDDLHDVLGIYYKVNCPVVKLESQTFPGIELLFFRYI